MKQKQIHFGVEYHIEMTKILQEGIGRPTDRYCSLMPDS